MAAIRPKDLDPGVPDNAAALVFDSGVAVEKATPSQVVDAGRPNASQAEAEAGVENTKSMTPLRVAQAITTQAVSPATLSAALAGKEPTITAGTTGQYWRGDKSWQTLNKAAVGLANVDNTSDANKPVSTATQTALNLKMTSATLAASGGAALVGSTVGNVQTDINARPTSAALAAVGGAALIGSTGPSTVQADITARPTLVQLALSTGAGLIGWIQTGTGAILRTILNKLRDTVSVKDFGAVGDGTSDDTAAIQAAFTKGGNIYFPDGTYKTTALITITKPVKAIGSEGSVVIAPNFGTGNVLEINGPFVGDAGVTLDGLHFKASVTRTSGAYVQVSNVNYVDINRCKFISGFNGVRYTGAGATGFYIRNCNFSYNTNHGILIDPSSGGVDQVIENTWILGPTNLVNSVTGVLVTATGDLTLRHVLTVWAGNGLFVSPTAGLRIQALTIDQCFFDSGTGYGIYCATNGGNVDLVKISDTWAATNQGGGAFFGQSLTGVIRQVDIVSMISANNSLDGFRFSSNVTNFNLTSCAAGQNVQNGCLIDANTNLFKVIGCTFGATSEFSANTGFGLIIAAGTSNNYIVSLNRVAGNGAGQISDGGTGVTKFVGNNI